MTSKPLFACLFAVEGIPTDVFDLTSWVNAHPPAVRRRIGAILRAFRRFMLLPAQYRDTEGCRKEVRALLHTTLSHVDGVDSAALPEALATFFLVVSLRSIPAFDPLDIPFQQRLPQLTDISNDPDDPASRYRARLRYLFESRRRRHARRPLSLSLLDDLRRAAARSTLN